MHPRRRPAELSRRRSSKPPGGPPLGDKRDLYISLVSNGMNNSEACRRVGVNRRTGTRWLHGRTITTAAGAGRSYPAITPPASDSVAARFLSEAERVAIADAFLAGSSIRAIAVELDRSPSTISREVRRNADPGTGRYHPYRAQRRAVERRGRPKAGKLETSVELGDYVADALSRRWSPEQISRSLPKLFPDRPEMRLAHETIYQAIYRPGQRWQREKARALRTGRTRRKTRRRPDRRTSRFCDPMVMIADRPATVSDRSIPGHWEGDLITGTENRSAIGTLVERSTRYVILLHLPGGHNADNVRDALINAVSHLPSHLARSLTWDQGGEMSRHGEFTARTGIPVYFCNPGSPWQRGSNENTNGLLREYFPKGSDLRSHSPEHLAAVAAELNARPRKTLNWDTPVHRLDKLLTPPR